uniref:Aldehyde dehydrogenase 8 family, member A1 n=1 Tax=Eptatretus burgeri TaxID=7764 RepID=A0A8C4WXE5_EPTBU
MAQASDILVLENFIDGKFVSSKKYIDSFNPSTGKVYCKLPDSTNDEVDAAVQAAKRAFPKWTAWHVQQRSEFLLKLADVIEARLEEFAQAESRDQGKTLAQARSSDIPRAVLNFRFFASAVLHYTMQCTQMEHLHCLNYSIRSPVGVAALIIPWNIPLYLLTWKLAPAIALGNTVVVKPSEMTSTTAWMLCNVLKESGQNHAMFIPDKKKNRANYDTSIKIGISDQICPIGHLKIQDGGQVSLLKLTFCLEVFVVVRFA